ncbi:MAG TPA: ribosome silencing factor [Anaeromyxobacter sp.]
MAKTTTKAKAARAPAKGKTYGKAPGKAFGKAAGKAQGRAFGKGHGKPEGKRYGKPSGAAPGKAPGGKFGKAYGKPSGAAPGKPGRTFRKVYGKASTASGRPQARTFERDTGRQQAEAGGRGGKLVPRRKPRAPRAAAPMPAKRVAPVSGPPGADAARPTAVAIAKAALDKKGEDVTVLDVRGLTSYADYFVVVTADSDRQASAIAEHVEQTMKEQGVSKVGVEGYESGRWILVDYGDVVAHVMNKESRGFYDLEGLWADAPKFSVEA